ncbi:hypothetical protein IWC96_05040 [Brevundimonas sp. BAL450]|uniref:hypothetical protein n=1 Tax=Brevundimonas sp. BAL450 TaxID=1708162 RepID=UPI0018CA953D|nr:hypothetical protein [Brevundimonas sp. BAL450]MBG7614646.1 hypothetical protein [Brevundimonas sp. BAL450]
MKLLFAALTALAVIGLGACGTVPKSSQQNADEVTQLYQTLTRRVTSADEAASVGQELTRHYLEGADRSRRSRRNTNMALLVINTYTLGALGLDAHPDNALVSSLLGNFVSGADRVSNSGGEQAWLDALLKTNCITQHLAPAYRLEAYDRDSWVNDRELVAAHDGLMRASATGFLAAYLRYRAASGQQTLTVQEATATEAPFVGSGGDFPAAQRDTMLAALAGSTTGVNACVAASA